MLSVAPVHLPICFVALCPERVRAKGLVTSTQHILQHGPVQRQIGDEPPQLRVPVLRISGRPKPTRVEADFLAARIKAVPYKVHTVLRDHGTHFTTPSNTSSAAPLIKEALARGEPFRGHAFQ